MSESPLRLVCTVDGERLDVCAASAAASRAQAARLIKEGCVIIAQHVNTMAPAIACEEAVSSGRTVYHVGYHQSMMDVAPSSSLVSIRTNWGRS